MKRIDEAIAELERATKLEPGNARFAHVYATPRAGVKRRLQGSKRHLWLIPTTEISSVPWRASTRRAARRRRRRSMPTACKRFPWRSDSTAQAARGAGPEQAQVKRESAENGMKKRKHVILNSAGFKALLATLLAAIWLAPPVQAQDKLDRTVLPIPEPPLSAITELDVRQAKTPPRFEVKAEGLFWPWPPWIW
jgi:hypothetical protein